MRESSIDRVVLPVPQVQDAMTEILREGARKLLGEMIQQEVQDWLAQRIRRVTVVQDPNDEDFEELHLERYRRVHSFSYLRNHILTQPGHCPACISDLAGDWKIAYPLAPGEYNFNICKADRENPATVISLDVAPVSKAQSVKA